MSDQKEGRRRSKKVEEGLPFVRGILHMQQTTACPCYHTGPPDAQRQLIFALRNARAQAHCAMQNAAIQSGNCLTKQGLSPRYCFQKLEFQRHQQY